MARATPFDDLVFFEIKVRLMRALVSFDADNNVVEMREALVGVLASVVSAPVLHGTDEDVFKVSLDLRGEIYSAIMQARRTLLLDIKRNPSGA